MRKKYQRNKENIKEYGNHIGDSQRKSLRGSDFNNKSYKRIKKNGRNNYKKNYIKIWRQVLRLSHS